MITKFRIRVAIVASIVFGFGLVVLAIALRSGQVEHHLGDRPIEGFANLEPILPERQPQFARNSGPVPIVFGTHFGFVDNTKTAVRQHKRYNIITVFEFERDGRLFLEVFQFRENTFRSLWSAEFEQSPLVCDGFVENNHVQILFITSESELESEKDIFRSKILRIDLEDPEDHEITEVGTTSGPFGFDSQPLRLLPGHDAFLNAGVRDGILGIDQVDIHDGTAVRIATYKSVRPEDRVPDPIVLAMNEDATRLALVLPRSIGLFDWTDRSREARLIGQVDRPEGPVLNVRTEDGIVVGDASLVLVTTDASSRKSSSATSSHFFVHAIDFRTGAIATQGPYEGVAVMADRILDDAYGVIVILPSEQFNPLRNYARCYFRIHCKNGIRIF